MQLFSKYNGGIQGPEEEDEYDSNEKHEKIKMTL